MANSQATTTAAAETEGIDGAIQSVMGPFVDFLEALVFYSLPIGNV